MNLLPCETLMVGNDVSEDMIAESLGISAADAASALFATVPPRSLDEYAYSEDDSTTLSGVICDEEESEKSFTSLALRMAIEKLPCEQRKLITLRYFRDYSQARVAEMMGITQVKVSREEKKIMEFLRSELT